MISDRRAGQRPDVEVEAGHLREQLIAELVADGTVDPEWVVTLREVPRHLFVPDTIWQVDPNRGGRLVALRRTEDPHRWLQLAYADAPVDTQVDDGHLAADGTGWEVTSSASQPSVVTDMLSALELEPGMRVMEIGTGTGWNAALLAHRVGAANVTTIEIDAHVAAGARAALDGAGYRQVTVITGDGALGWPRAARTTGSSPPQPSMRSHSHGSLRHGLVGVWWCRWPTPTSHPGSPSSTSPPAPTANPPQ
jgi:protein-L-isoaspartate O-methyltransferase